MLLLVFTCLFGVVSAFIVGYGRGKTAGMIEMHKKLVALDEMWRKAQEGT